MVLRGNFKHYSARLTFSILVLFPSSSTASLNNSSSGSPKSSSDPSSSASSSLSAISSALRLVGLDVSRMGGCMSTVGETASLISCKPPYMDLSVKDGHRTFLEKHAFWMRKGTASSPLNGLALPPPLTTSANLSFIAIGPSSPIPGAAKSCHRTNLL